MGDLLREGRSCPNQPLFPCSGGQTTPPTGRPTRKCGGSRLRLTFSDGAVKDVDLHALLGAGGVFAAIRDDRAAFEQVRVNPETQTIEWPG
ncbi:MAG: DUF2442 domain-containing protein, partial [Actinobacteria bacterium]|nr:DUF2442 domain-containing protein [Actinomycetota bacterium]